MGCAEMKGESWRKVRGWIELMRFVLLECGERMSCEPSIGRCRLMIHGEHGVLMCSV